MDVQIAERLQNLRKEHGYSQEQLADELGVSRQAVSKWERGEASPDTENLIALAKLYNITVDEVLFSPENSSKRSEPEVEIVAKNAEADDDDDDNDENGVEIHRYHGGAESVVAGVTVMLCCIAYFLMGGVWDLWHPAWIVFFAIPVLPTVPAAIRQKDMHVFCFPVLIVAIYLLLGCVWGWWHPGWVVFFFVPIYYIIADGIKKK